VPIQFEDVRDHELEDYGPGEIIYTQGETPEYMYMVFEGEVVLKVDGQPLATVGEGGVFGEMALVERRPRPTLAEAVGDVRVFPVDRERFETLVISHPELARTVLHTMAVRLREVGAAVGKEADPGLDVKASDSTSRLLLAMKGHTTYAAGQPIYREGEKGVVMYFVQDGKVELRSGGKGFQVVEAGSFFGEMALIDRSPRNSDAVALGDCRVMQVNRDRFEYLIRMTPDFVFEMMRTIAARERAMARPA
jgi:CRP-like cAMP-binding protein